MFWVQIVVSILYQNLKATLGQMPKFWAQNLGNTNWWLQNSLDQQLQINIFAAAVNANRIQHNFQNEQM